MIRKNTVISLVLLLWVCNSYAQSHAVKKQPSPAGQFNVKWTKDPFDQQVFIENKGQFDTDTYSKDKILFQVKLGDVKGYFTTSGLIYKYDKLTGNEKKNKKHEDDAEGATHKVLCTSYDWKGANAGVAVNASDEQSYYYTYPTGKRSSIQVNIFKKLVYHNIYPGIDVEYSFIKGKPGIKYSLIVHPGADVSMAKLEYKGISGMHINSSGDIQVEGNIGEITDHAPATYYQGSGEKIKSSYKVNGTVESFAVERYDSGKDIVIDPWSSDPNFTAPYDRAYDVDYDNNGNVYVYGSNNPFQLTKFNNAGIQQWTYNATSLYVLCYGDFAVDKASGTSYVASGITIGSNPDMLKINSSGALVNSYNGFPQGYLGELWRLAYDQCTGQIVICCGSEGAAMLDTTFTSMTIIYSRGFVEAYDDCLMAIDPSTSTLYFNASIYQSSPGTRNDSLISVPISALAPANYCVGNQYDFVELLDDKYLMGTIGCGMNGMAVSPAWLYMYDGSTLTRVNKNTGAPTASLVVNTPAYATCVSNNHKYILTYWGGLDADNCNNAYVGMGTSLQVYDSALALQSTTPLQDTVFDVVLGSDYKTVYTCGRGYVSSLTNNASSVTISNTVKPARCNKCSGSATPNVLLCGSPPSFTPTYTWNTSPVQTTQTATGLCPGKYSVAINLGCGQVLTDSVTVSDSGGSGNTLTIARTVTNVLCFGGTGNVSITNVTGGSSPYFYSWNTGQTTSSLTNVAAGTYTVTVSDSTCDMDTAIITINEPPVLTSSIVSVTPANCNTNTGSATISASGGSGSYTYSWAPSGGTNATAANVPPGSYTCTITDKNGCTKTQPVTITSSSALPKIIISNDTTIQLGSSTTISATGGTSYSWTPSTGLSCATCPVAIATPSVTTHYCVTVSDSGGCSDSTCMTVSVDVPCGEIFVPNAFSPNNDQENDMECVYGGCIETFYFAIFDRWGNEVFEAKNQEQCWNGTYNGVLMNTGVYVYYLRLKVQ